MVPPSPRIPKTHDEIRDVLTRLGYPRPPAWTMPPLNLPEAEVPALADAIGPGWRIEVRRRLAHGRVVVDIVPPRYCHARPSKPPCEAGPTMRPSQLWAMLASAATFGTTARSRR